MKRKDQAVTPVKVKGKAGAHIYTPLHLASLDKTTPQKQSFLSIQQLTVYLAQYS